MSELTDINELATRASNAEQLRNKMQAGSRALSIANKRGKAHRSKALALYNKARARYQHAVNGTTPPELKEPDFFTELTPFKCGVHIISAHRGYAANYFQPAEAGEAEFCFVDKNGYPLDFVDNLISDEVRAEIERECVNVKFSGRL